MSLRSAAHLGEPPAQAYEQKSPIVEEFRLLAFEGVADELQHPAEDEQTHRVPEQGMHEHRGHKQGQRNHDRGNAEGVAEAVYGMLMAGRILRDPLLAALAA